MAEIFMRIESKDGVAVNGGSMDEDCTGWIELASVSFGTYCSVSPAGGTNSVAAKPGVSPVSVSKSNCPASTEIQHLCAIGHPLKKVTIRQYAKAGRKAQGENAGTTGNEVMTEICMTNAYISDISYDRSGSDGAENFNLQGGIFIFRRTVVNPQHGTRMGMSESGWDLQRNKFVVETEEGELPSTAEDADDLEATATLEG